MDKLYGFSLVEKDGVKKQYFNLPNDKNELFLCLSSSKLCVFSKKLETYEKMFEEKHVEEFNNEYNKDYIYINKNVPYFYFGPVKQINLSTKTINDEKKEVKWNEKYSKKHEFYNLATRQIFYLDENDKFFSKQISKEKYNEVTQNYASEYSDDKKYEISDKVFKDLSINNVYGMGYYFDINFDKMFNNFKTDALKLKEKTKEHLENVVLSCLFSLEHKKENTIKYLIDNNELIINNDSEGNKYLRKIQNEFKKLYISEDDNPKTLTELFELVDVNLNKFIFDEKDLIQGNLYLARRVNISYDGYYISDVLYYFDTLNNIKFDIESEGGYYGPSKVVAKSQNTYKKEHLFIQHRFIDVILHKNYSEVEFDKINLPVYDAEDRHQSNYYLENRHKFNKNLKEYSNEYSQYYLKSLAESLVMDFVNISKLESNELVVDLDDTKAPNRTLFKTVFNKIKHAFNYIGHQNEEEIERVVDTFSDFHELLRFLETLLKN